MITTNAYAGVSTPVHLRHHRQTFTPFPSPHPSIRYSGTAGGTRRFPPFTITCSSSSDSNSGRGFGPQQRQEPLSSSGASIPAGNQASKTSIARDGKDGGKSAASRGRKSVPRQPGSIPNQAPAANYGMDGTSKSFTSDLEFEERLQAVKRSALNQKKAEEKIMYGTIDYDAPVASEPNKIGLGSKIGVGVAVVVFGLVFALGDFIPSGSVNPNKDAVIEKNTLSPEEKETLQTRLQQYEATLSSSPDDLVAREGAAVTLTELGDYARAVSMLEDLTKMKPSDPEVFRLLGEVKFELKDYEGSAAAYRSSAKFLSFLSRFQIKWIFKFSEVSQMHCLLLRNLMRLFRSFWQLGTVWKEKNQIRKMLEVIIVKQTPNLNWTLFKLNCFLEKRTQTGVMSAMPCLFMTNSSLAIRMISGVT